MNKENQKADWNLWESIPQCCYTEAVVLSLDIEPPTKGYTDIREYKGKLPSEYDRREKIALAHIQAKYLPLSSVNNGSYKLVDLPVFGAWAKALGWSLPDQFPIAVDQKIIEKTVSDEYISNKLKILNQAAYEFWSSADPDDASTHPKQQEIIDWLLSKDFSMESAKQGAVIIRTEWAAKGRRSK